VGECSFWYRPTRVVPDQRPLNGRCIFINLYIAKPTYRFILIYTCGLTAVIKRICYVITATSYWLLLLLLAMQLLLAQAVVVGHQTVMLTSVCSTALPPSCPPCIILIQHQLCSTITSRPPAENASLRYCRCAQSVGGVA